MKKIIVNIILLNFCLLLQKDASAQNYREEQLIIGKTEFTLQKALVFLEQKNNTSTKIIVSQNNSTISEFDCDSVFLKNHLVEINLIIFFNELNPNFIETINKLGGLPSALYEVDIQQYDSNNNIVSIKKYNTTYRNRQSKIETAKLDKRMYSFQFVSSKIDTSNIDYTIIIKPYSYKTGSSSHIYRLPKKNEVDLSRFMNKKSTKKTIYTAEIEARYNGFIIGKSEKIKFRPKQNKKDFNIKNDSNLFEHPTDIYVEKPLLNLIDPSNKEKNILAESKSAIGIPSTKNNHSNFNSILSAKGSFSLQSYYSNVSYPTQFQPNKYVRFIANPTVSVGGLPFDINLFLSTENTPINPVNSFTIGFDAETFKNNMEQRVSKKEDLKRKIEALRYQNLLGELKKIDQYKDKIEKLNKEDSLLTIQSQNYSIKKYSTPTLPDSLKFPPQKLTFNNSYKNDSLFANTNSYIIDSLALNNDSTYLILQKGIKKRKEEKDSLLKIITTLQKSVYFLQKLYKNPSGYITEIAENNSQTDSLDDFKEKRKEKTKGKIPIIQAVKKFNFGLFNPFLSPLTLQGIPVKGFETQLEFDKSFYSVAYGKTIRTQNYILNTTTPQEFDRNFRNVTVGFGKINDNNIYLSILYFNDKSTIISLDSLGDLIYPEENLVYSLGGKTAISKKVNLASEINYSYYSKNKFSHNRTNQENTTFNIANHPLSNTSNFAANNAISYSPQKSTTITFNIKYIGSSYTSLGVPFLRNDYHEEEIKVSQSAFKKKLRIDVSYKENRDNISNLKSHKTTMRGASFSLRSNFTKYPNLLFSYIPFSTNSTLAINQTVNNLPIYSNVEHIYNYTNITILNIYHYFTHKKTIYYVNVGYTKNKSANNLSAPFTMEGINGNLSVSLPNRTTITFLGTKSRFYPASDSLSSQTTANLNYTAGIFKMAKLSIGGEYISNKNRREAYGLKTSLQFSRKKINYIFQTSYRKLEGNWGIPNIYELIFQSSITFTL